MFGSILGKKKESSEKENRELIDKIAKMNLTEMRQYVNNKLGDLEVSEDGLNAILKKLIEKDAKTGFYLKKDDMDSKKKKAFDLVLSMAQNRKINVLTVEYIQKFAETYIDLIRAYDKEYKEIYESRFQNIIDVALANIAKRLKLKNKMDVLQEN